MSLLFAVLVKYMLLGRRSIVSIAKVQGVTVIIFLNSDGYNTLSDFDFEDDACLDDEDSIVYDVELDENTNVKSQFWFLYQIFFVSLHQDSGLLRRHLKRAHSVFSHV